VHRLLVVVTACLLAWSTVLATRAETNLLQNGGFEQGFAGWTTFVESGSPAFGTSQERREGAWSIAIRSDGQPFVAGVWQQVAVQVGAGYRLSAWMVSRAGNPYRSGTMQRQVGIDPTGGINPRAPTVVWSGGDAAFPSVGAIAQNSSLTVFLRLTNPQGLGRDEGFIDDARLILDPSIPTPTPAPPTSTPAPPTATPLPPTSTPRPTSTVPRTPTTTASPTTSSTATATRTSPPPPSSSPTATATATPSPPPLVALPAVDGNTIGIVAVMALIAFGVGLVPALVDRRRR
jgi:hypothetical protein